MKCPCGYEDNNQENFDFHLQHCDWKPPIPASRPYVRPTTMRDDEPLSPVRAPGPHWIAVHSSWWPVVLILIGIVVALFIGAAVK